MFFQENFPFTGIIIVYKVVDETKDAMESGSVNYTTFVA